MQDLATTREELAKIKRQYERLDSRTRQTENKKMFDPTKAFHHAKENQTPPVSPLRPGKLSDCCLHSVPNAQGKLKFPPPPPPPPKKKKTVMKKAGNLEICINTENFVCSSCKFLDSKSKEYCGICRGNFILFFRSWIHLPSRFCVCNGHKSRKLAQGNFAVGQGKQGILKYNFSVDWSDPATFGLLQKKKSNGLNSIVCVWGGGGGGGGGARPLCSNLIRGTLQKL